MVGPCAAGKSTLVAGLKEYGYPARGIAQEHSFAPSMWKKITNPDVLIYLDVSYENTISRSKLNWTIDEYNEQLHRLRHARQFAHLIVDTNPLTIPDVLETVLNFVQNY